MKQALGDIAEIRNGYPFRGRISDDPAGDIAVLTIKDIAPGEIQAHEGLMRIQASDLNNLERYLLQEGDVIFQSRGFRHGAIVVAEPMQAIAAQGLYQIRPDSSDVLGGYLAWYLNHENCQRQLLNTAQGTRIQLIPRRELTSLHIAVPPMDVQNQILRLTRLRQQQRQAQAALDEATDQLIAGVCWQKTTEE